MPRILLTTCLMTFVLGGYAQNQFSVGYAGSYFTRPGVHLNYQAHLRDFQSKKDNITNKALLGGVQLGLYHHPGMQWGSYLAPEISFQKQNEKGFRIGYELGIGALFTQPSNLYSANDGQYEKAGFQPDVNLVLTPAISLGKEIKANWADAWYIKNRVMLIPFYAEQSTFRYFFEVGITKSISKS